MTRPHSSIEIKACTARHWLHQLRFTYHDVRKDVNIDGHEQADIFENPTEFLQFLADLEPYLVEFDFEGRIKEKNYPPGCEIGKKNW